MGARGILITEHPQKANIMQILSLIHRWRHHLTLNNGAVVLALLIALGWLWGTVGSLQKNFLLQQQVDAYDQEIEILKLENQSLGFQSKYYASDEYIELSARERLNKALPGEHLVILPPQPAVEDQTSRIDAPKPMTSNFEQWVRFFFGRKT
jgi:cell division protein FtsB